VKQEEHKISRQRHILPNLSTNVGTSGSGSPWHEKASAVSNVSSPRNGSNSAFCCKNFSRLVCAAASRGFIAYCFFKSGSKSFAILCERDKSSVGDSFGIPARLMAARKASAIDVCCFQIARSASIHHSMVINGRVAVCVAGRQHSYKAEKFGLHGVAHCFVPTFRFATFRFTLLIADSKSDRSPGSVA